MSDMLAFLRARASADEPFVFLTCQRTDGTEYQHPLMVDDIGPGGEWQVVVPDGTRSVAGIRTRPGDTVSGRLTLDLGAGRE